MKIGIIGLGLIGGSIAKAIRQNTKHEVLGFDVSEEVQNRAKLVEVVDDFLIEGDPSQCDMIIIALYPTETLNYLGRQKGNFKKNAIVIDCCGIKTQICEKGIELGAQYGFHFVGGHPMAGIERSGFVHSNAEMFKGATMILTPQPNEDLSLMNTVSQFFRSLGFGKLQITTWQEHDRMIAYTSQLAHVVSSAYIKNDLSYKHKGFSAGSFQDMTRVAKLNEVMWTNLFMDNRTNLLEEIEQLIKRLSLYRDAIEDADTETLKMLLKEGKERRQAIEEEPDFE